MNQFLVATAVYALVAGPFLPRDAASQVTGVTPVLEQYLHRIGLGPEQLATAASGRAVVKLLPTSNGRDVAVFGMIGVRAARDSIVARLDPIRLLAEGGTRFHPFGHPPTGADVRDVAFDIEEYRDLEKCRPGSCHFKLPASAMTAFSRVDWSAPDAKAQVDRLLRAGMLRVITDYMARGDSALVSYDDVHGVRPGDVFGALTGQSSELFNYAPELERYLRTYPSGRPGSARDILYWAEDRPAHLRPLLTVNHAVVYLPRSAAGGVALIGRKQIYADHYFEGAFELLAVVDATRSGDSPAAYLVVCRRYRFDKLSGGLINVRGRARSGMVDRLGSDLAHLRSAAEQAR